MKARKDESQRDYLDYKKYLPSGFCHICERQLLVKEFNHWTIIKNKFPYDNITEIHHLLSPKRHISKEEELTFEELAEYYKIKSELTKYTSVLYNLPQNQSVKGHLHFHLIKLD